MPCVSIARLVEKSGGTQTPQSVTEPTLTKPIDKSRRKMVEGMNLFEKLHAMAPRASLGFKLLPRERGMYMHGVSVKLIGNTKTDQVIASDQSFILSLEQLAIAEDAMVNINHHVDSMSWRSDIRTPGLPPNTGRVGDLCLGCRLGREAKLLSPARL